MKNILHRKVLVLNSAWQLINEISVQDAINRMAANAATALDIHGENNITPVKWEDWLKLPILDEKECLHTPNLKIRMPTVIVAVNYAKVPKRRPKFTLKNIARRDNYRDQYTGDTLAPHEWSMDHVNPLSRGGEDAPHNVVLTSKKNNNKKGNKLPEEVGFKTPKIKRLGVFQPEPTHKDHEHFIIKTS